MTAGQESSRRSVAAGHATIAEIEDGRAWNELLVSLDAAADLRQAFEWGELRRRLGWRPYRYVVLERETPIAAIAILARSLVATTILYAPRGPVVARHVPAAWPGILCAIHHVARRTRALMARCSPRHDADDRGFDAALAEHGFRHLPDDWSTWNAPRITMTLDLHGSEEELLQRMRSSTRRTIVKSGGSRIEVAADTTAEGVQRVHRLLISAGRRQGWPVHQLDYFEALRRLYMPAGAGCVLIATQGGVDLAGLIAVRFGRQAHLLYSALNPRAAEARRGRPGTVLHWELIRWAKTRGCDVLDWGGSTTSFPPRRDDRGYGIYEFKRGFGCRLQRLAGYYDVVLRPRLYPVFRALERAVLPLAWKLRARGPR